MRKWKTGSAISCVYQMPNINVELFILLNEGTESYLAIIYDERVSGSATWLLMFTKQLMKIHLRSMWNAYDL